MCGRLSVGSDVVSDVVSLGGDIYLTLLQLNLSGCIIHTYKASPSLLLKVTTNLDIIRQRSASTIYNSIIIIIIFLTNRHTVHRSAKA